MNFYSKLKVKLIPNLEKLQVNKINLNSLSIEKTFFNKDSNRYSQDKLIAKLGFSLKSNSSFSQLF